MLQPAEQFGIYIYTHVSLSMHRLHIQPEGGNGLGQQHCRILYFMFTRSPNIVPHSASSEDNFLLHLRCVAIFAAFRSARCPWQVPSHPAESDVISLAAEDANIC